MDISKIVTFRQMKHGTRGDYLLLDVEARNYARGLPDSILAALRKLDVGLQGYPLSRLAHSLQCATRAAGARNFFTRTA